MKKKRLWLVVLILSLVVIIGCGTFLLIYFFGQRDDLPKVADMNKATDDHTATTVDPTATDATEAPAQLSTTEAFGYGLEVTPDISELSFDELMEINRDVYAWIYIPGTNVDYPVLQSLTDWDDSFYLHHNVYRQYQFSGCIFSEVQNALDFEDPVTVLYGHNMLSGSMFATLHRFSDKDFFDQYNTAFIFTRDKVLTYLIYSAYIYDDRHILNSFNMYDEDDFRAYRLSTLEPRSYSSNVREGVELDEDSKILTLSTCGGDNGRLLVQGVLVDEQERIVE